MPPYSIDDLIHGTFPSMSDTDRAILLDGALDDLRADHLQALDDVEEQRQKREAESANADDIRKERDDLLAKVDRAERVLVAVRIWIASGREPDFAQGVADAIEAHDLPDARRRALDLENLRAKPSKKR